jgi:hypothetical protein
MSPNDFSVLYLCAARVAKDWRAGMNGRVTG